MFAVLIVFLMTKDDSLICGVLCDLLSWWVGNAVAILVPAGEDEEWEVVKSACILPGLFHFRAVLD